MPTYGTDTRIEQQPVRTTKNKPAPRIQARRSKQKAARAARRRNRKAK